MHQHVVAMDPHQGLEAQPLQQLVAVVRLEHLEQRCRRCRAACSRQRPSAGEVVVAEHDARSIAQPAQETQHAQGFGALIDEVADDPQPVDRGIEGDAVEHAVQRGVSSPDVADCVVGHRFRAAAGGSRSAWKVEDRGRRRAGPPQARSDPVVLPAPGDEAADALAHAGRRERSWST